MKQCLGNVQAVCKRRGYCCKGAIVPLQFEKLCFAHSLLIGKIWKKAELLAWKGKKRLSSKPRGLNLNVFLFLFVLNLFMHFYAILFFFFAWQKLANPLSGVSYNSLSAHLSLVSPLNIMNSHKLLYFKNNRVSLLSLDSKKYV